MKSKHLFTLIVLVCLSLVSYAQDSNKIAGSYKIGQNVLIINAENTCFILAENSAMKGTVEINGSTVKIKPYSPKAPFVMYGRKSESIAKGNKVMFRGFDEGQTLLNVDENNDNLQKMTPVFNVDANCVITPIVIENSNHNSQFYFAINGESEVYAFSNNEGYSDFIVLFFPPNESYSDAYYTLEIRDNQLFYAGEIVEKATNSINTKEIKQMMEMYDRAFPSAEKYYCNPAYNYFEEYGIDVHSGRYERIEEAGAYYFVAKEQERGDKNDYHNSSLIYEYTKMNPIILMDKVFTIETKSIFTFKCDNE